jgi:hypothetical protein
MALTQIDKIPALVVIDLQKGIVGTATAHPAAEILTGRDHEVGDCAPSEATLPYRRR